METTTRSWKERFGSFFLALAMVFTMIPTVSFATDGSTEVAPTVTISRTDGKTGDVAYGDTLTLKATLGNEDKTSGSVTWTTDADSDLTSGGTNTVDGANFTANQTMEEDKSVTITATYTYTVTETDDSTDVETSTAKTAVGTFKVTFEAYEAPADKEPKQIAVTMDPTTVEVGKTGTLTTTVTYDDWSFDTAASGAVSYKSGDSNIASVSSGGTVTGRKVGTTTITATYKSGIYTLNSTITVTVTANDTTGDNTTDPEDDTEEEEETVVVDSMYLSYNGSGVNGTMTTTISTVGTTSALLTVMLMSGNDSVGSNSNLKDVEWSISPSSSVVTMSTSGSNSAATRTFTAVGPGEATVTASYGGLSATFKIVVSGITIDTSSLAGGILTHAQTDVLTVKTYGNVNGVSWSSRNGNMIAIEYMNDEKTEAILKSNDNTGSTYIDITSSDGSLSFPITVNEAVVSNIIPAENINVINVLRFSTLIEEFKIRCTELYPGETLVSLQSIEVPPAQGTLYVGYQNEGNPGAGLATSQVYTFTGNPGVSEIVFVPNAAYTGTVAIIKYTGRTSEDRTFYGEIHVTLAPSDDVLTDTTAKEPVTLDSYSFAQVAAKSGKTVDYVVFSIPDENRATLYYDYKDPDNYHHRLVPGEEIDKNDIDRLTVIPTSGYTGSLVIPYIITATDGSTIIGELTIEVAGYGPEGPIVYNTVAGEYVTLITADFETNVQALTGQGLNYITFTLPEASKGTLYEVYYTDSNYRKAVTANTAYHASARSPQISEVSFVPSPGFTGSCDISFVGYDLAGNSYQGTIEINVGTQALGDIAYTCSADSYVPFYDGDFNQFSREQTGYNVDYIYFPALPSSSQGTLRLGQTTYEGEEHSGIIVNADQKYYLNDTPLLGKLSFEAATSFSGMVTIPFAGASAGGTPFAGTLTILVANQNLVKIPYSATHYSPATMSSDDFDRYSQQRTGSPLDYVRFELPLDTDGILYYNYTNGEEYGSLVDVGTSYYVNQSHFLNSVTFVPDRNFQGTVQIDFTAWAENGQSFSGVVAVYVADGGDPLSYYMYTGDSAYLNSDTMNDFCFDETGSSLNYITIQAPDSSKGYLYQDYDPTSNTHTSVGSTTKIYKSQSPYISNLAFVSVNGYVGNVSLPFTAYATDGSTCTGTINILVRPTEANASVYYYTGFSPIQITEQDIYNVWGSEAIDYVEFHNIPTATQGKLYYENNLSSFATTSMKYYSSTSSSGPYISNMVFAPRAGFSGTMILSYTATTISGRTFSGDICVVVTTGQPSLYFDDMSHHLWATASADYLYITKVSTGTSEKTFAPSSNITRGDFALMVMNAFRFTTNVTETFSDVPSTAYYASAVHTLRSLGVTSGYNNTFKPNENISRQDAMVMLATAMNLASKGIPSANVTVLNEFSDSSAVADYAKPAMASMVAGGLMTGSGGYLNPNNNMTRAEMAVVLHQAMTY